MKRFLAVLLLALLGLQTVEPAFAARRVRVVRHGPYRRTTVVVYRGWPLRRPARVVYVRPVRTVVRVHPVVFLPVVVFTAVPVARRAATSEDVIVWRDSDVLDKGEDWTELALNADRRGRSLWLEVESGRVQIDWAEVVFENGDTRVVDFQEVTLAPGLYSLLDFADGRMVDHVRLVARAKSDVARIGLRMEK